MTRQKDFDRWMAQDAEIRTLQAENIRLREQAEALAAALDEQDAVRVTPYEVDLAVKMFNRNGGRWESESDEELVMKWEWRKRNAIELAIVALRAYREATP